MSDHFIRAIAGGGTVLGFAAVTTETVEEARRRHQAAPTAAAALGRTLAATVMLGAGLKDGQRLTVRVVGGGPVGRGTLHVTKDVGLRYPYHGSVPLVTGEIGEDLAHYLVASEQVPSVVALGVLVAPDHHVEAAGGFIVQVLPGASPEIPRYLEERIVHLPTVTQVVRRGRGAAGLLHMGVGDLDPHVLEEMPVAFRCGCSRERVEGVLVALGREEVERLLQEKGQAEVICRFCGDRYVLDAADAERLFRQPA